MKVHVDEDDLTVRDVDINAARVPDSESVRGDVGPLRDHPLVDAVQAPSCGLRLPRVPEPMIIRMLTIPSNHIVLIGMGLLTHDGVIPLAETSTSGTWYRSCCDHSIPSEKTCDVPPIKTESKGGSANHSFERA